MKNFSWNNTPSKWIARKRPAQTGSQYLRLVKDIVTDDANDIEVKIAAFSKYQLFFNGQFIARGPAPGDKRLAYYHTVQISKELIRSGENRLAVLLFHEGAPETIQGFQYYEPGLLLYAEQNGPTWHSDTSWKMSECTAHKSNTPMISAWSGFKQYYHGDAVSDWTTPSHAVEAWDNANEVALPEGPDFVQRLLPLDIPELEKKWIQPKRIIDISHNLAQVSLTPEQGTLPIPYSNSFEIKITSGEALAAPSVTFDFGHMVVGHPKIKVNGGFCIYEVAYGESLDLYRLDVIRNSPSGEWHSYQRRAFRFMQIKFIALPQTVTLESVDFEHVQYDFPSGGHWKSSSSLIDEMMEVSKRTLRINTSYHFEDCPWRERACWIYDLRIMAVLNYYHFGDARVVKKCLIQQFALQDVNGAINATGPRKNIFYMLDFMFHLVGTLREYYQYTGDTALVDELLSAVLKIEEFAQSNYLNERGLLNAETLINNMPFLDWSPYIIRGGAPLLLNCLYLKFLEDLQLLEQCTKQPLNQQREETIKALRTKIHEVYFDPEKAVYRDTLDKNTPIKSEERQYTFQGNIGALLAEVPQPDQANAIVETLLSSEDYPAPFGPSFYFLAFEAIAGCQNYEAIWETITTYWKPMLDRGATEWWEVFDIKSPNWSYPHPFLGNTPTHEMEHVPISTCHGWSGIPGYAIQKYLLGIDLLTLHTGKLTLSTPKFMPTDSIHLKIPLRDDFLEIVYKREDDKVNWEILNKPESVEVVSG